MIDTAFTVVLVLNLLWFSAAFHYFSLKPVAAAKVLVPPSARDSPLFPTLAASLRFLGGMNLAFAVLSLLLLCTRGTFASPAQRAVLLAVFAVAHAGQFYFNVPIALGGGRRGESPWNVLTGPMRLIFVVDAVLALANLGLLVACLVAA